jgi:hypothetical protein
LKNKPKKRLKMFQKLFQTVSCLFHRTYLRPHNSVIFRDDEMKNLKIIGITATIAILAIVTTGVVLAHNFTTNQYYSRTGYSAPLEDVDRWDEMVEHMEERWNEVNEDDWWNEMIEHMDDHWDEAPQEIQDEEWFNDMRAYMQEHLDDVQSQEWFDEMIEFMEDQRSEYRYQYEYYPRSYGRGCMGW